MLSRANSPSGWMCSMLMTAPIDGLDPACQREATGCARASCPPRGWHRTPSSARWQTPSVRHGIVIHSSSGGESFHGCTGHSIPRRGRHWPPVCLPLPHLLSLSGGVGGGHRAAVADDPADSLAAAPGPPGAVLAPARNALRPAQCRHQRLSADGGVLLDTY